MSEHMSQIHVKCTDQVVKIVKAPVIASGGLNEVSVVFDFCEKWDGFVKTALFYRDSENIYYSVLDDNDTCTVPWEVCYEDGYFFFSVFGEKGNARRTSNKNRYRVIDGAITEGFMPSEPTPDVYDQLVALVAETKEVSKSFREEAMEVIAATKAATAEANAATEAARASTENAIVAKENAENAAMQATAAKEAALLAQAGANAAAQNAESEATAANTATASASAAAEAANTASRNANTEASNAKTATTNAERAKAAANEAANKALDAEEAANKAATAANNAKTAADTAATRADEATAAANNAASVAEAATAETVAARESFLETAGASMQAIVDLLGTADEGPAIVCEESGSVISLNDSSNRLLKGFSLYGKTTQDGTPTPDNPVEMVSAGASGAINTTVTGKNLFDESQFLRASGWTEQDGVYHGDISALFNKFNSEFIMPPFLPNTQYTISLSAYDANNPTQKPRIIVRYTDGSYSSITLYAAEWTSKVFTTDASKSVEKIYFTYASGGTTLSIKNMQVEIGSTATTYEPYECQTLTAQTPNGLPGIPVTRVSGNYTDANGQQWICDTIDFATGIYTKRVETKVLTGAENWKQCSPATWYDYTYYLNTANDGIGGYNASENYCLSNQYIPTSRASIQSVTTPDRCAIGASGREITFTSNCATVEEWKAELAQKYAEGNPVIIQYVKSPAVETPLSAEELAQYAALHTNKPNTTVYNDAGAGMKLQYVADTKIYIDNKFTELQNAILSSGANV